MTRRDFLKRAVAVPLAAVAVAPVVGYSTKHLLAVQAEAVSITQMVEARHRRWFAEHAGSAEHAQHVQRWREWTPGEPIPMTPAGLREV